MVLRSPPILKNAVPVGFSPLGPLRTSIWMSPKLGRRGIASFEARYPNLGSAPTRLGRALFHLDVEDGSG
jgi:hypothetical protein